MNLVEVKDFLYEVTAQFFVGASIIWAEQINTKPTLPYVTLKCGNVTRTAYPMIDGEDRRVYQLNIPLEVNLYTKGKPITVGEGVTGNYVNTATSDLMEFANFVESEAITDMIAEKGMDISLRPPIQDLVAFENDVSFRYRAMAEFTVSFAQEANGTYGLGGMPQIPNSSGGGIHTMTEKEDYVIESIEIEEGGIEEHDKK